MPLPENRDPRRPVGTARIGMQREPENYLPVWITMLPPLMA